LDADAGRELLESGAARGGATDKNPVEAFAR